MLMALEGTYMHANQTIAAMLEYDKSEFAGMPVGTVLTESRETGRAACSLR